MPSVRNMKKVWVSDTNGRSFFGWRIKEEIFAIFFILVLISLANDENIVENVNKNLYIQIFIVLTVLYCIYNKIPWSLAFVLLFVFSLLFSGFIENVKSSLNHLLEQNINKDVKSNKDDKSFMNMGAKVLGWMSKEKIPILK